MYVLRVQHVSVTRATTGVLLKQATRTSLENNESPPCNCDGCKCKHDLFMCQCTSQPHSNDAIYLSDSQSKHVTGLEHTTVTLVVHGPPGKAVTFISTLLKTIRWPTSFR